MRINLFRNEKETDERVEIYYKEMTHQINQIICIVNQNPFIIGIYDGKQFQVDIAEVYYFESVDKTIYLYTKDHVYRLNSTLKELEDQLNESFVRVSKSMIVNLFKVKKIKADANMRLLVTLLNDELVLISRHYRKCFYQKIDNMSLKVKGD